MIGLGLGCVCKGVVTAEWSNDDVGSKNVRKSYHLRGSRHPFGFERSDSLGMLEDLGQLTLEELYFLAG